MKTSSSTLTTIYPSNNPTQQSQISSITKQLDQLNNAYVNVFNNYETKSELVSRKHAAYMYNKMSGFLEQGTTEVRNEKKEMFARVFRGYIAEFVHAHVVTPLLLCCDDYSLIMCLIEKWENFKKFCYIYSFLFKAGQSHYQTSYKAYKNQGKSNKIQSQDSIFPIAAIAIYHFDVMVYSRFQEQIIRAIRFMMSEERHNKQIEREALRVLIEIVYSAGLGELARINFVKIQSSNLFYFHATTNKEFREHYSNNSKNPDANFFRNLLNYLIQDSQLYYTQLFNSKITWLGPQEDFTTVWSILQKQEEISEYYLFNNIQKNAYLNKIKDILVLTKLEERLNKQNGLRYCLQRIDSSLQQHVTDIKLFIDTIFKAKSQSIKILQNVIKQFLLESGARINQKINKKRQHMTQMINLKKTINRVIDELMHKELHICIVRDKCFKKILDSIQCSKNLADYVDFKVKECIKNKCGDAQIIQKTKDIFLILQNLAATDSFLLYHQQMLGRRLLQPLNEPKTQIQKYIIRKIGQQLGSVTVSAHSYMIKDIQKSQQTSEVFNKKLPFSRFKFSCRIISPQFWSDSINNNHIEMILPEAVRIQAQTIKSLYYEQYSRHLIWKIQKGSSLFQGLFKNQKYRFQSENIFAMLLFHISQAKNQQMHFWQLQQKIIKKKQNNNYIAKSLKALIDNGLVLRTNADSSENISQMQIIKINTNYKPPAGHKPNQTIVIKVSQQMHKAMHETNIQKNKILKQRQKIVEAVIVKILKHSHSTGTNRTTLQEIVKGVRQYQFLKNLQIPEMVIKQRLQDVIARGFCQRDQNDRKVYQYIA